MSRRSEVDISVIIPVYNAEKFLDECLMSVFSQKHVEIEVIAIDDGSSDTSWTILQRYEKNYEKIIVHRQEVNKGQAAARNLGLVLATGEFVFFLDSDDYLGNDSGLHRLLSDIRRLEVDVLASNYTSTSKFRSVSPSLNRVASFGPAFFPSNDTINALQVRQCWQMLYRREFLSEHSIQFSDRLRQREDRLFIVSTLFKRPRVAGVDYEVVVHRQHPAQTTADKSFDQFEQFILHMKELEVLTASFKSSGDDTDTALALNAHVYCRAILFFWRDTIQKLLKSDQGRKYVRGTVLPSLSEVCISQGDLQESVLSSTTAAHKERAQVELLRALLVRNDVDTAFQLLDRGLSLLEALQILKDPLNNLIESQVNQYLPYCTINSPSHPGDQHKAPPRIERLILHVGFPKVGSSSLQASLERSRTQLLQKSSWFPISGFERGSGTRANRIAGHARLAEQLLAGNKNALDSIHDELEILGHPRNVILSVENLLSLRWYNSKRGITKVISQVVSAMNPIATEIIVFQRNQIEWLDSYYREILGNHNNNFSQIPSDFYNDLQTSGLLDIDALSDKLQQIQGVQNVHICDASLNGFNLFDTFESLTGLDGVLNRDLPPQNSTVSWDSAMVSLLLKTNVKRRASRERLFGEYLQMKRHPTEDSAQQRKDLWSAFVETPEILTRGSKQPWPDTTEIPTALLFELASMRGKPEAQIPSKRQHLRNFLDRARVKSVTFLPLGSRRREFLKRLAKPFTS